MEKKTRGRPPKDKPINWEAMSKKLQKALEDEIAENKQNDEQLNRELMRAQQQAHDNSVELIKAKGIIEYLESKLNELELEMEENRYDLPPLE